MPLGIDGPARRNGATAIAQMQLDFPSCTGARRLIEDQGECPVRGQAKAIGFVP